MNNKPLILTTFVSLLIFMAVTFTFSVQNNVVFDQKIADWISDVSSPVIMKMMELISVFGSSEVILLITGLITVVFLIRKSWYHMFLFLTVSVGGVFLNFILKMIFQRERPGGEVSHIEVFNFSLEIPSYSFPSGHTMRATILLLFLMYLILRFIMHRATKVTLVVVISIVMLGVALSRLFLEAHFLSDTIAAMSISVTWFCLCLLVLKRFDLRATPRYRPVIGK